MDRKKVRVGAALQLRNPQGPAENNDPNTAHVKELDPTDLTQWTKRNDLLRSV